MNCSEGQQPEKEMPQPNPLRIDLETLEISTCPTNPSIKIYKFSTLGKEKWQILMQQQLPCDKNRRRLNFHYVFEKLVRKKNDSSQNLDPETSRKSDKARQNCIGMFVENWEILSEKIFADEEEQRYPAVIFSDIKLEETYLDLIGITGDGKIIIIKVSSFQKSDINDEERADLRRKISLLLQIPEKQIFIFTLFYSFNETEKSILII